jgi:hypothetical protein
MGYHTRKITKGKVGEVSKIKEEVDELMDAAAQPEADLLMLIEMSDIVGSIKLYLSKHHPTMTIRHLEKMADLTASAFKDGDR